MLNQEPKVKLMMSIVIVQGEHQVEIQVSQAFTVFTVYHEGAIFLILIDEDDEDSENEKSDEDQKDNSDDRI